MDVSKEPPAASFSSLVATYRTCLVLARKKGENETADLAVLSLKSDI